MPLADVRVTILNALLHILLRILLHILQIRSTLFIYRHIRLKRDQDFTWKAGKSLRCSLLKSLWVTFC